MNRRENFASVVVNDLTPVLEDTRLFDKRQGSVTHSQDELGLHSRDLRIKIVPACLDLPPSGGAIVWWPTLGDVRDEGLLP
jgi:hypothetical protein